MATSSRSAVVIEAAAIRDASFVALDFELPGIGRRRDQFAAAIDARYVFAAASRGYARLAFAVCAPSR